MWGMEQSPTDPYGLPNDIQKVWNWEMVIPLYVSYSYVLTA